MFSWICPRCGREVPPSYTECPDCAAKGLAPLSSTVPAEPPVQAPPGGSQPAAANYIPQPASSAARPPAYSPQPPYAATQPHPTAGQPAYQQHPYQHPLDYPQHSPARAAGLPTWLLTMVFTLAFVGLVGGIYWMIGYFRNGSQAASPPATVESPAAKPGAKASPFQKYIEVSGIRFTQDAKKKTLVQFTLTNHSDADLSGIAGNVTIWGHTQKSEEDAVGTFAFASNLPPQTSKELSAPLTTKLKIYELPDWQNITTDLQITAPQ
ncbi:MAG: hypothetical protein JO323_09380 [Acidobacteriia bacterium]|nr:hypothetical protein [Terriglobia bacterium]